MEASQTDIRKGDYNKEQSVGRSKKSSVKGGNIRKWSRERKRVCRDKIRGKRGVSRAKVLPIWSESQKYGKKKK